MISKHNAKHHMPDVSSRYGIDMDNCEGRRYVSMAQGTRGFHSDTTASCPRETSDTQFHPIYSSKSACNGAAVSIGFSP